LLELAKSLRGLNHSFLQFIQSVVAKDCFADLSVYLEQYQKHHVKLVDGKSVLLESLKQKDAATPSSNTTNTTVSAPLPATTSTASPPKPVVAPPVPPVTGFSFGSAPFSFGTTSNSTSGGFKFGSTQSNTPAVTAAAAPPVSTTGGFKFGSTQSTTPAVTAAAAPPVSTTGGFSFGSTQSTTPAVTAPLSTTGGFSFGSTQSTTPAFTMTAPKINTVPATPANAEAEEDGEDGVPKEEQIGDALMSGGAGEEHEATTYEVRCKLFESVDKEWKSKGIGLLKIKKDKASGKSRVLVRADGSGRILLNAGIYGSMPVHAVGDTQVSIVMQPADKLVTFLVKVKTKEFKNELVDALKAAQ
jgi:nucleoporin NUP2